VDAKLWSMDLALFQVVRWPWTCWGFFQGMWAGRQEAPKPFRVTPKGLSGTRPLGVAMLSPLLVLGTAPALVLALVDDLRAVLGLALVLTLQCVVYLGATGLVIAQHVSSNVRAARAESRPLLRAVGWTSGGSAALATLCAAMFSTWVLALRASDFLL